MLNEDIAALKTKLHPSASSAELPRREANRLKQPAPVAPFAGEKAGQRRNEMGLRPSESGHPEMALGRSLAKSAAVAAPFPENSALVGCFTLSRSGLITQANSVGRRQLNGNGVWAEGRCFSEFVAEADLGVFEAFLGQVFAAEPQITCEIGLTGSWQPWRTLHLEASLALDGMECRVVAVDITLRKQTEAALILSEERLRLALEAAQMGTFDWEIPRNHITWSRGHEQLWGFGSGEFNGTYEGFAERIHPDDLPCINAEVARCIAGRESYKGEFRVILPDGSVHWMQGRGAFTFSSDGQALRMLGVVQEIGAQKEADAALRESETRFRSLFEQAAVGVGRVGIDGRWLEVNQRMCEVVGYTREELQTLSFQDITHVEDRQANMQLVEQTLTGERDMYSQEQRFVRKDGANVWTKITASLVRGQSGVPAYFIQLVEDISEGKRSAELLRALSHRLLGAEDQVRRRIAKELHDSTAQDLVAVMLNLGLLEDELAGRSPALGLLLADSMALIEKSATDIRTLSYILHPPQLDEVGLVRGLIEYAAGFSKRSEICVRVEAVPQFPRLSVALEVALFRVAQESLANVFRHSGSDSAMIRLEQRNDEVIMEIEDYGKGLPPELNSQPGARGVGIEGMRERMCYFGGVFEMHSGSHGTTVRAVLPQHWDKI